MASLPPTLEELIASVDRRLTNYVGLHRNDHDDLAEQLAEIATRLTGIEAGVARWNELVFVVLDGDPRKRIASLLDVAHNASARSDANTASISTLQELVTALSEAHHNRDRHLLMLSIVAATNLVLLLPLIGAVLLLILRAG